MSQHDKPSEELLVAGDAFRQTMIPRADLMRDGYYPMWHGWALMDAFIAGAQYATASADSPIKAVTVTAPDGSPVAAPCAISGCQYTAASSALPQEATPEMIAAVGTILQPYAAKLVWKRMLEVAPNSAIASNK